MTIATSAGAPELRPLDPDALSRLERFGGEKLLREMIALYLESAPERLAAAEAACAAGDAAGAENAMHSLKSSSAQLGASRLSRLCGEGEILSRSGTLSGVSEIVASGKEEYARVEEWLLSVRAARST